MFYKISYVATPGYLKPLLLENYIRIVVSRLIREKLFFHSIIKFFNHNSTVKAQARSIPRPFNN